MYGITLMARVLAAVFLPALVASCGSMRPSGPPDAHDCGLSQFEVASPFSAWGEYRRALIRTQGLSDPNPSFNVLALSAGGEYGAYGAGFLSGWSSVGDAAKPSPRRDIQVVTGVSTGAILATHAFVGMDSEIEAIYRSLSGPVLYKPRSTFALLIANSLLDASGKEALIAKHLERKLINAVAAAPAGRFLYLGVVDMDTGRFLQIDMLKLARTIKPLERRDDCYRAVVNASSAIPIAFPPVFVDARMLADGGARRHLFVTDLPPEAALPQWNVDCSPSFTGLWMSVVNKPKMGFCRSPDGPWNFSRIKRSRIRSVSRTTWRRRLWHQTTRNRDSRPFMPRQPRHPSYADQPSPNAHRPAAFSAKTCFASPS